MAAHKRDDSQMNIILSTKAHAFSVASLISPEDEDGNNLQDFAYSTSNAGMYFMVSNFIAVSIDCLSIIVIDIFSSFSQREFDDVNFDLTSVFVVK